MYLDKGPFLPIGLLFDGSLPVFANDSLKRNKLDESLLQQLLLINKNDKENKYFLQK